MTNEEHLEEVLIVAHRNGVYSEIISEVDDHLLINRDDKFSEVLFKVFYKYVKEGKIEY
jgi:hypothetical protein